MASLASACRSSARAVSKAAVQHGRRSFTTTSRALAAHNFTMPAMSPTMTEGNITTWKLKEGDSFSAGDVILEIETDKAQMDVEAQDDGILAKITTPEGSKAVKVGTRIAVLADSGDDVSSLEIPPEDTPEKSQKPKEEKQASKSSEPPAPQQDKSSSETKKATSDSKQEGKAGPQKYPLYPSVQHLLKENGLNKDDADKIPATGPSGRLLKGDVLAYLGKIEKSHPGALSARLGKLAHLDLSNIKLAQPAPKKDAKKEAAPVKEEDLATEVAVPISLVEVLRTQKKLKETLGLELPLTTFIARAVDLANQDLPLRKTAPTADELFNAVLGLDKVKRTTSTGQFIPQIMALPSAKTRQSPPSARSAKAPKSDIFDILAGKPQAKRSTSSALAAFPAENNVFSLTVAKDDVKRATIFLERIKGVLEKDVGTLVL